MKLVDRYVTKTIFSVLISFSGILVGLLLLHRLYRIVDLAVARGLNLLETAQLMMWAFPIAFLYALPLATLAAVLLALGKFSADEEMTACLAAGISRFRIAMVPLLLALVLAGGSLINNVVLIPESYRFFDRIGFGVGIDPFKALTPGQLARVAGRFFSVEEIDVETKQLSGLFAVLPIGDIGLAGGEGDVVLVARDGKWRFSGNSLLLDLQTGTAMQSGETLRRRTFTFNELQIEIPFPMIISTDAKRLSMDKLLERGGAGDHIELVRRVGGAVSIPLLAFCGIPFVIRSRGAVRKTSARGAAVYAVFIYFFFWLFQIVAERFYLAEPAENWILAAPYAALFLAGAVTWRMLR